MDYIETLRGALNDPAVPVTTLSAELSDVIHAALQKLPTVAYVSEWKYEAGSIRYRYKMHSEATGEALRKLLADGKVSRHPRLTAVYSLQERETILAGPAGSPACSH